MVQNDIIIIGGGISGLSLAFYCAKVGLKTTLLEKNDRPGGAFHSHRIHENGHDFWCELGAHTCYNSYQNLLSIVDECQLDQKICPRAKVPFTVLLNNEVKSIFPQINFPELLVSLPRLFVQKKSGQSVASYYSKVLGKRNFQKLFRHFFNAVPSQSTDNFPADILFKKRQRRKDVLRSYTFVDGVQTITDALVANKGVQILTEKAIRSIEQVDGNYRVIADDDSEYEAKTLALATPASVSAQLLQKSHPDISQHLSQIQMAKVNSVGIIVEKGAVPIKPVAGIISPDDLFYSIVSRDIVPHDKFRGFTFHFKPDVADRDVQAKRITEVLGITSSQIEYMISKLNIVPSLKVGHHEIINDIDTLLADQRLLLTGNYFLGLSIEDCVSRSLHEFQRYKSTHL